MSNIPSNVSLVIDSVVLIVDSKDKNRTEWYDVRLRLKVDVRTIIEWNVVILDCEAKTTPTQERGGRGFFRTFFS